MSHNLDSKKLAIMKRRGRVVVAQATPSARVPVATFYGTEEEAVARAELFVAAAIDPLYAEAEGRET